MNLYFSDSSFKVGGISYSGFPLLVNKLGEIVQIVLMYLKCALLENSGARDLKTWATYGGHLYDYFGFLEARPRLRWDHIPGAKSGDISPLAHYIEWCRTIVGNEPGYINDKVGTVQRFYRWAFREGLVESLPFVDMEVALSREVGILDGLSGNERTIVTTDKRLSEPFEPIKLLTQNQIGIVLREMKNPTHHGMLNLGLSAGLRAAEIISFPAKYVVDCSHLSNKVRSVRVLLDPSDMDIKNKKSRNVQVSVGCMNMLWQYRETVRHRLECLGGATQSELFLTRFGVPFKADGFISPLDRLGEQVGFHIHPHMLRHTFATHSLDSLEKLKREGRLRGSPIVILAGWLGHASVTTTMRYIHYLNAIDDEFGTQYQAEIDELAKDYLRESNS